MKKIIIFLLLIIFLFGCSGGKRFYNEITMLFSDMKDNRKEIFNTFVNTFKIVKVNMTIETIKYYENKNIFLWKGYFVDNNNRIPVMCSCVTNKKVKDIILSGKYKIKLKVFYDIKSKKYYIYPIWIKTRKDNIGVMIEIPNVKLI